MMVITAILAGIIWLSALCLFGHAYVQWKDITRIKKSEYASLLKDDMVFQTKMIVLLAVMLGMLLVLLGLTISFPDQITALLEMEI